MIAAAERIRSPFLRFSLALHVIGLAVIVLYPGRWPWVVGCLFVDHVVAMVASMFPRSTLVGPNIGRAPGGDRSDGTAYVVLTIDDGPDPEVTPAVLDILARHQARATFFCIAREVERHPELARRIVEQGHRVENHTYRHSKLFSFSSPWGLKREIGRAQDVLAAVTGRTPQFFRAPAGVRNPWLDWTLAGAGLHLVSWTRRAFDTMRTNPERVLERLLRDVGPGDVLAMHDGNAARCADGQPVIVEVLPVLLAELAERRLQATFLASDPPVESSAIRAVSI